MLYMKKRVKKTVILSLKIGVVAALFGVGILSVWASTFEIPDLESFEDRRVVQSTKIFDRTGEVLLYELGRDTRRTVIPFDEMSRNIKNATLAIEDNGFYEHNGIKIKSIVRAMVENATAMDFQQGGSTITQQVVKNSLLTNEKKVSRKIKEWVIALKLERQMSKEDILELYLNEIPYGGNIYGIEAASQHFFGKPASDLGIVESAYLAALPKAPTYYSPYGNNRDKLEGRKNIVLYEMWENSFITEEEYEEAREEEVDFAQHTDIGIKAPHFVLYIQDQLQERYGQRAMEQGMKVITTLDWDLQEQAEGIVKRYALENENKFNAENAGMVAVDPKTGHILTMVGSRDYLDPNIDGMVNVTLSPQQPGSAFKPFVYATAFKKGYTPETVVFDVKTQFSTVCSPTNFSNESPCFAPGNYDNAFRGPITFRNALAQSVNIPAVKVLYLAGVQDSINTARSMGVSTLTNPDQYGLSLVLGSGDVTLLDMTGAYGTFATEGVRNNPVGILRIENNTGQTLHEYQQQPTRALDEQIARQISDVLSDNTARAPAFGQNSYLHFPGRDVAVKTGTTNDYRDAWIIGYTPTIAVGAWAGNNDNTSMEKRVAGFIVAPLWNEFMQTAINKFPEERFTDPQSISEDTKPMLRGIWRGGRSVKIDTVSGKRATEHTPKETTDEILFGGVHNILHWIADKDNPNGAYPEDPTRDSQYALWEYPVRQWVRQNNITTSDPDIPEEEDPIHTPERKPTVTINGVSDSYRSDERIRFSVEIEGPEPPQSADIYVNGRFVGTAEGSPIEFSFVPADFGVTQQTNTLKVVGYDRVYNSNTATASFRLE